MVICLKKFLVSIFIFLICTFTYSFADDYNEEDIDINELKLLETVAPVNSEVKINSRAAIVFDRNSQMVLYEKNADSIRPMASTTKIMSAIIVLQNSDLSKVVTISKKAASTGGSVIGLKTGDKITIHDLLCGLLIRSGNDAAVALAEEVAGNVEEFANMMNVKAEKLGLKNTHFVTPHGLDANEHYTTAKELALLADYALKIPKFKEIVSTKSYILTINGKSKTINNTNELLGYTYGVYGIKTGFTNGAGRCLVTSTKRENMDIITVVLGSDTKKIRSQDSIKLIEYAFKNFELLDLNRRFEETFDNLDIENYISINKGKFKNIEIDLDDSPALITIKSSDIPSIDITINYDNEICAPIEKGYILGSLSAKLDDNVLVSKNIIISSAIPKKTFYNYLTEFFANYKEYVYAIFSN